MDSVLSAGASATATDEVGRTPLHHLLSRVSPQLPIALIKRILAESDVRLEEKDAAGQRPLHCLLRHLNTEGNTPVRCFGYLLSVSASSMSHLLLWMCLFLSVRMFVSCMQCFCAFPPVVHTHRPIRRRAKRSR